MLDDMFSFIDPIIELDDDNASFVIQADIFYEFIKKLGIDKKPADGEKIEVPIHIVLSLLRPDELEKLKRYITSYEKAPDG